MSGQIQKINKENNSRDFVEKPLEILTGNLFCEIIAQDTYGYELQELKYRIHMEKTRSDSY